MNKQIEERNANAKGEEDAQHSPQLTAKELGRQNRCMCCGNSIRYTTFINAYWVQGNKFIYNVCPRCYHNKYLLSIMLRIEGDEIEVSQ